MRQKRFSICLLLAVASLAAILAVGTADGAPPWARLVGDNSFSGTNVFSHATAPGEVGLEVNDNAALEGVGVFANTNSKNGVALWGNYVSTDGDANGNAAIRADSNSGFAPAGFFTVWANDAETGGLFRVTQMDPGTFTELGAFVVGHHGAVEISGDVELTGLGPTQSGDLTAAGSVYATSFIPTSAARFKRDIAPLADALGTVERLRGVSFAWADDGRADIGVVAEEVAEVLPELVRFDDDGRARGVDYSKLTAVLIEAVKAQQIQIDALRDELIGRHR